MHRIARTKLPMNQMAVLAVASSILLSPVAYAKHASFDMPACDKLLEGDGPSKVTTARPVNDQNAQSNEPKSSTVVPPAGKKPEKKKFGILSPMKLTNDQDSFSVGADGKVKLEVQQNVDAQVGPSGQVVDPTAKKSVLSNEDKLNKKLLKDSQTVNVAPIALQETEGEAQQKQDTITDAERMQLTDLWTATINKSPDIQFVINRLQPTSNQAHVTAKAIQMIGGALFQAVSMAPMMMPGGPSMGMYMGTTSGVSMLQSLLNEQTGKNIKKQQITQEQATMLYTIVRQTAEKVVIEYRKYRHNRNEFDRATRDLEDLKSMVASAHRTQDPAKQIEMEYTIRKAQRDVDKIIDEAKLHRQQLVDLAGSDSMARLDTQMEEEVLALKRLVGAPNEQIAGDPAFKAPQFLDDKLKAPTTAVAGTNKSNDSHESKKDLGPSM